MEKSIKDSFVFCIMKGNTDLFFYLIKKEKSISDKILKSCLIHSASYNNIEILNYVLDKYPLLIDIKNNEDVELIEESFFSACQSGYYDIVEALLIRFNINPAKYLNQATSLAFQSKAYNIVYLFWKDDRVKDSLMEMEPHLYKMLKLKDIEDLKSKITKF